MTIIGKKLKSNRGVSLIVALLFFLLAFMVTAVILTATAANTNRIVKIREEKQTYLTTLSVANMIKDSLNSDDLKLRIFQVSYTHECRHYSDSEDHSTHEENGFALPSDYDFYKEIYDNSVYAKNNQNAIYILKNDVQYGFDTDSNRLDIANNDTTFTMLEKVIAEMTYEVTTSAEDTVYKYIGCDMGDILPESYEVSVIAQMNKNYDLTFIIGTVCGDTSYYMTIKTRTVASVPSFSRDEFIEMHSDSSIEYSIFFDIIQTDYKWDVISFVKGATIIKTEE